MGGIIGYGPYLEAQEVDQHTSTSMIREVMDIWTKWQNALRLHTHWHIQQAPCHPKPNLNSNYLLSCITECKQCKNHDLSARCPLIDLTAEIELPDVTDRDFRVKQGHADAKGGNRGIIGEGNAGGMHWAFQWNQPSLCPMWKCLCTCGEFQATLIQNSKLYWISCFSFNSPLQQYLLWYRLWYTFISGPFWGMFIRQSCGNYI